MAHTNLRFTTKQWLTSEEQARIKTVLLRALSQLPPSAMDDQELDAICKLEIKDA